MAEMPMDETMTAAEAVAWIASRDKAFADERRDESLTAVELRLLYDYANLGEIEKRVTPTPNHQDWVFRLVMSCRKGSIVAKGVRQRSYGPSPESDKLEEIGREDWETLWLAERGDEVAAVPEPKKGEDHHEPKTNDDQRSSTSWHFLRFSRADVMQAFPETANEAKGACDNSDNSANSSEQSDGSLAESALKREATKGEVETEVNGLIEAVRGARDHLLAAVENDGPDRGQYARQFFRCLEDMFSAYLSPRNWPPSQGHPIVAIPHDIAFNLSGLCGYLAVGKIPDPIRDCIKGSGSTPPGPSEQRDIRAAVAYVKAVRSGAIDDCSHIKTVSEAYGVSTRTVHDWVACFQDHSLSSMNGSELKSELLPERMRRAGERYKQAGRSNKAISKRSAKRQS
jgi:hypothetical protein